MLEDNILTIVGPPALMIWCDLASLFSFLCFVALYSCLWPSSSAWLSFFGLFWNRLGAILGPRNQCSNWHWFRYLYWAIWGPFGVAWAHLGSLLEACESLLGPLVASPGPWPLFKLCGCLLAVFCGTQAEAKIKVCTYFDFGGAYWGRLGASWELWGQFWSHLVPSSSNFGLILGHRRSRTLRHAYALKSWELVQSQCVFYCYTRLLPKHGKKHE